MAETMSPGSVWLVGAGPGDPELLTRKAERLLREAEIVFHDALVGDAILELCPQALTVSVGKRAGRHSKPQAMINWLLVEAARAGKKVVRLKGGDPSVFGRATEEMDYLRRQGVGVHICPGITAASAAAASALTSLTLRGVARRVTLMTAQAKEGDAIEFDWQALAAPDATLAIYMGRSQAALIAKSLIKAGRSPETPVLVAVNASLPTERILRGKLSALPFLVQTISEDDPTLLLIGEAVGYDSGAPRMMIEAKADATV